MNANRRLQERKQPGRTVFCKLGGEGEESSSVLNLSEGGLCFESLTPIEEKDLLHLRLSVDLNSAIEASAQLAWVDSAKRTGGLRFLELSAPAREHIRAWLSGTSTAASGRDWRASLQKSDKQAGDGAATEMPVIWQEMPVRSIQLVPIGRRYRAQMRRQFLLGVLMGFGIGTAVMTPIFRYAAGAKPGNPALTTASENRAAQSSVKQTQASVVQPVSPSASITEPAAVETVYVAARTGSPQRRRAGASSTDLMTRTSSPAATPQQLWSALQAGNTKAAVALADLYTRGQGVPVNCDQARILLRVASEKNNAEASKKLQELDQGGCPQTASEPKP